MSPVCPECGNVHLEQCEDKKYMQCGDGHRFELVKVEPCLSCGRYVKLLSNGLCVECIAKIIAKEVK